MHRLLVFLLVLLWSLPAFAGSLVLLPGSPVIADGKSPATMRVYAPGITGADKVKINPDDGRVSVPEIGADGVITFTYIPPALKAPREIGLSVKVQGSSLRVEERLVVNVMPPYAGSLKVSFDPPEFVGGNASVLVRITPDASSAQNAESRRMLGLASVGSLDTPIASGDGTYVARWTPPASLPKSRSVIIAVADAAAPDQVVGWGVLPVLVKTSVTLNAAPGSNNLLIAGDRQWGPLAASPAGTVAFDVEVNPGKTAARLQTVAPGGSKTETVVNLPLEEYNRVSFFPLPPAMPADPAARLKVRVAATKTTGEPLSNAAVSLRATAGQLEPAKAAGVPGIYEATFIPPEKGGEVIFTAEIDGQKAEVKMRLLEALPSVNLSAEPSELAKGQTSTVITARVKDARGGGVVGRPPELTVQGGNKPAKATDNKDGSYSWKVTLTGKTGYMLLTADPPVEASGLGPSRLLAWPGRSSVAANGSETVSVTFAAVDAFGLPVAGIKLKLAVPVGDGSLPPEVTTNSRGLARVAYRSGSTPGPVTVRADGAGLWTETTIFQAGPGALTPSGIPTGSPEGVAALTNWQMAAPALIVSQEGSSPTAKAGPPAVVTLSTVPPYTTPGAAILVIARVTDAAGIASTRQKLVATASPGTAGAVTDNGDGSYTFPVQLPAGQDGPLTLTVKTGTAQGSVVLPTLMGMQPTMADVQGGGVPGGSIQANNGDGGGSGRAPRAPKAPQGADSAWGRVSVSLATVPHKYRLCQLTEDKECVSADDQSLNDDAVPDQASFNKGPVLGGPGLDARLLLWPGDKSIGIDARVRGYFDRVEVGDEKFTHLGRMAYAGLRYRKPINDKLKWYAGLDAHRFGGIVFLYADDAKTSAQLINKGLWGGRVNGGLVVDAGTFYMELSLAESFAPFPVDTAAGLELVFDLSGGVGLRFGFDYDLRTMTFSVDDETRVRVFDQEKAITVGMGMRF